MNKQSYYLLGGALLASTALTTAGHAAVLRANLGGTSTSTTTISAKPIATQVFSGTVTVANTVQIGDGTTVTANNSVLIDFASSLTTGFNVQLNVVNAAFTGTPGVTIYAQSTNGTLAASGVGGCSVQALADKILITGCAASATTRADAIAVTGLIFTSAGALAASGQSISLNGNVTNSAGSITFENITSANFITSKSAADATVDATTGSVTIDNAATPVFSTFTGGIKSAVLGSIHFSATAAVGTDLSNTFGTPASITGTAEVKVAHSALTDPALVSVSLTFANLKATPGQFISGTVSFQVPAASLAGNTITVVFDGTTGILASTGTGTATVTPTTGASGIVTAVAPFSGNLASYTRGGLSVEVNSMFPTAGEGSTKYRSYLRIANQSATDATAVLTVKNDTTGALIGTFASSVIKAGGTIQIGSDVIEANVSGAVASGAMYKVVVTGSFNGYVQNVLWNSVTGIFTDLSGFRNGALTSDP